MTKINNVFLNFRIENLAKVFPHMVRNCCKYCEITFGHNIVFDHDRKNIYFLFNLFFQDDYDDDNNWDDDDDWDDWLLLFSNMRVRYY